MWGGHAWRAHGARAYNGGLGQSPQQSPGAESPSPSSRVKTHRICINLRNDLWQKWAGHVQPSPPRGNARGWNVVTGAGLGLTLSELMEKPRNTVAVRGQSTQLVCQSSGSRVSWKFTSVDGEHQAFIYNNDGLNPVYRARNVSVRVNNSTGHYRLHFHSVQLTDAGTYTCQDGQGIANPHAAWLAVLGIASTHCTRSVSESWLSAIR